LPGKTAIQRLPVAFLPGKNAARSAPPSPPEATAFCCRPRADPRAAERRGELVVAV
jgi:hypothetical protein